MNLDSEKIFIQLMTLENASLKRFKFMVDIFEHYVFVSNSVLSVLISDV